MDQILQQINDLTSRVKLLERNAIQIDIDPTITLYLNKSIDARIALQPTQTYSTSLPTGVAPKGSVWFYNTGTLATNRIYASDGTTWIQIK